jgi:phosphoglycerate kinase
VTRALPRGLDALEVGGRRILCRVDFNVPIRDGAITDDTRIRAALPTIAALRERRARVILCAHLGRPKGRPDPSASLAPVRERLASLLGAPVGWAGDCIGEVAEQAVAQMRDGDVLLLENVRFHAGETANDPAFAAALASLAEAYVDDAFGAAHRAHASTEGVAHLLPAAAGLLLRRELQELGGLLDAPERPFVVIAGGVKVADKIGVLESLAERADSILIGGAMAFTFAAADDLAIGESLHEGEDGQAEARRARAACAAHGCELLLPDDVVAGRELSAESEADVQPFGWIQPGWMGLDIGPRTALAYASRIATARTVFWNGPMGAFELPPFAAGTLAVAQAVADCPGHTVVGGGDPVAAITQAGVADRIDHVSTGGGAGLELLEGHVLPGVAAIPSEEP